jgi:hypothetical protein
MKNVINTEELQKHMTEFKIVDNRNWKKVVHDINNQSNNIVWEMDSKMEIKEIIESPVEKLLGYNKEDIVGEIISKFLTVESLKVFQDEIKRIITKQVKTMNFESVVELDFVKKDKSILHTDTSFKILTKGDEVTKVFCVSQDISSIKISNSKFKKTMDNLNIGILILKGDDIRYYNKQIELYFKENDSLTQSDLFQEIEVDDRVNLLNRLLELKFGKNVKPKRIKCNLVSGRQLLITTTIAEFISLEHIMVEIIDITKEGEKTEYIKVLQKALVECRKNIPFKLLAPGIIHEVTKGKEKLETNINKLKTTKNKPLLLEYIDNCSEATKEAIDNTDLFKILLEEEKQTLYQDLNNFLGTSSPLNLLTHFNKYIKIKYKVGKPTKPVIININRLIAIIVNLIQNSIHQTKNVNISIHVENFYINSSKYIPDGDYVQLAINDKIPIKNIEKVCELPFKDKDNLKTNMGIYVSKSLIEEMGWYFICKNRNDCKGSNFNILIPVAYDQVFDK